MPSPRRTRKRSRRSARRECDDFAGRYGRRVHERLEIGGAMSVLEESIKTSVGRKGAGSDSARSERLSILARLLKRPELGALSGAILVYVIFYFLAGSSGMFTLRGMMEILQVSAEIGILATTASLLMIAGEFDLSMGSMIGFAGVIIGLGSTVYHLPLYLSALL